MKVHFIQHDPWVLPGEYLAWAEQNQYEVRITKCWLHDPIPENADADILIVLGGFQNPATTKEECSYFDAAGEKALIRCCVESGMIVIGVCLGAQLIGEALGAVYAHSPEREIGAVETRLTREGRADPFFQAFPGHFLAGAWHNDMPGLTEDSIIIAESDGCPRQIIRYGKYVYGFQTHMEFTHEVIAAMVEAAGESLDDRGRYVQDKEQLFAFDYTEMNSMLVSFLDAIVQDYRRQKEMSVAPMNRQSDPAVG